MKQKRKDREHEEIKLRNIKKDDEDATTMKARLMLEMHSSLSSKIAEMFDPNKLKQFSLDHIEYLADLGEGQFGLVFKGMLSYPEVL